MLSSKISNLVVSVDIASHGTLSELSISMSAPLSTAVSVLLSCSESVLLLVPSSSETWLWCCKLSTSLSQSSSPSEPDGEHNGSSVGDVEMSSLQQSTSKLLFYSKR